MTIRPHAEPRSAYPHFSRITSRSMGHDAYGHINNVVYYSFFDTVVNGYLIERGALDIRHGPVVGLVVETRCNYFKSLQYPQPVDAGLRVAHIGRSSVRYEIALFAADAVQSAACGHFVHVYVERASQAPTLLPTTLLDALAPLRRVEA